MTLTQVAVPIAPSFILQEAEYCANSVSYDPATNVLMIQWDRSLASQSRQFVFPTVVDGHAVSVAISNAPRNGRAVVRRGSIILPALLQSEECIGEITFTPTASAGKPLAPKIKIKITIRGRPTGGG